ncbi:MAG: SDR family oxidoreductase [Streptomycetales bacterium]
MTAACGGAAAAPFALQGRTALVTGSGSGIGQAIATGLAAAGADLVLLSERDNMADTVARVEAHGRTAKRLVLDLSRVDELAGPVDALLADRQVDILVNNAGIIRRQPAAEFSDANWYDVLDVNLNAVFALTRRVAGPMLERRSGKVVNIASLLSFQGGLLVASYAASKHAVVGLTRALANEWAPCNVQVNAIAPGYIETQTTAALRADPARNREILARIPAGRWGVAGDVSAAAVFLAAPASGYVTGHVLAVDGGWLAR